MLTDTGMLAGGPVGRVVSASWPDLEAPDPPLGGQRGEQRFVDLGPARILLDRLDNAYEGWLWDGGFDNASSKTSKTQK